jgi:hypothetical protein
LQLQSIDFHDLASLPALDHETALRRSAEAFSAAGVLPASANPIAATTKFTASFVEGEVAPEPQ